MRNLVDMFEARVAASAERDAVAYRDETVTWAELRRRAARIGAMLRRRETPRGAVVAILAEHSLGQFAAMLGAAMADCVYTLINQHATHDQIVAQVSDSDACALIATARFEKSVAQLAADRRSFFATIDAAGHIVAAPDGATRAEDGDWRAETAAIPTDVACLMYTSGSSGRPKGVVVPHRTLTDGARIVSGVLDLTPNDKIICILQFGFDYGLNQILSAIYSGAEAVIFNYLLPTDLFNCIEEHRVTGMAAVPSMWPALLDARYEEARRPERLDSLRYVTTAGGPHSEELLRKLVDVFPSAEVQIFYGLTESFRSTHLPAAQLLERIGSIGKAVPEVEILVLNEAGEPCAPGEKGVLHHRGAFITYGYLNNPELTASVFIERSTRPGAAPERIVRSGDLVSLDEDGFIYFHGRVDQMIKTRGYRVSPGEVELAAASFAGLGHVAAFGASDPELGQAVWLCFDASTDGDIDEGALRKHLARLLPYYAMPKHFRRVDAVPKTPNGKIDYTSLRAIALKGRAA